MKTFLRVLGWVCALIIAIPVLVIVIIVGITPPPVSEQAQEECESVPGRVYHTGGRHAGICFESYDASIEAEKNQ